MITNDYLTYQMKYYENAKLTIKYELSPGNILKGPNVEIAWPKADQFHMKRWIMKGFVAIRNQGKYECREKFQRLRTVKE